MQTGSKLEVTIKALFFCLLIALAGLLARAVLAQFVQVTAQELAQWLDGADAATLLIDLRDEVQYAEGSLPTAALATGGPAQLVLAEHHRRIVLIPSGSDLVRTSAWIRHLANTGKPVFVLQGGVSAWLAAGYELTKPDSAEYTRPGSVPFIIPRGICEGKEPVQVFD